MNIRITCYRALALPAALLAGLAVAQAQTNPAPAPPAAPPVNTSTPPPATTPPVDTRTPPVDTTGKLGVRDTLGLISRLDLFLSPDTGTMHMACAVGTPSVTVFGPSDPARYFSGGGDPRHVVVRPDLWCSPCNLIRKPPAECAGSEPPECLRLIGVDQVRLAATAALRDRVLR